jgi:hypothetical protein
MLIRLRVVSDSIDAIGNTFQARGPVIDLPPHELDMIIGELDAGAVTRFYRGGKPEGWVIAASRTAEGLSVTVRMSPRAIEAWKLVETGAINTVEIQPLTKGVDVFLKSVAATYPAEIP